jgi:uncharacterized protein (UPF0335 family)
LRSGALAPNRRRIEATQSARIMMVDVAAAGPHDAKRKATVGDVGGIAAGQLRAFVERIERLEEEKKALAGDIKEVYAEAKGNGFDTKILRKVISIRKLEEAERQEQESLLDLYMSALGMVPQAAE